MITRLFTIPKDISFFLFGPRQTGKSTLVDSLFPERVWKVELLQSDQFLDYTKDPSLFRREAEVKLTKGDISTIVVDEIQRVPLLLNEIHYLIEKYRTCRFVLTGSSARKLRAAGTNLLAGRAIERHLFPFTVQELGTRFDLESALQYGTLPSTVEREPSIQREILTAYVHTYLQEEIRSEGLARNLGSFSRFLDIAASQNGEPVNFSAIARDCMLSRRTVESYYEILEDTLIAIRLDAWQKSLRKRLTTQPRYYLFDTGVTNAVCRRLTGGIDPALRGRLFEQFIVLETYRLLKYKRSEATLYCWRTSAGAEVDLVIEKHGRLVAACEIKSSSHISGADCSGLLACAEDNPGVPCNIVCPARNAFDIGNVHVLPWNEYLARLDEWL
jgi:predicted AAA+ superfamily ATPase